MEDGVEATEGVITVAIIEDNRLVREGLAALINQLPNLRVVSDGWDGDMTRFRGLSPQVVLLDLGMPNGDSLRIAERVRRDLVDSKIIVMDLLPVQEEIMEFVKVGVSGFIMKDATVEDLEKTIRDVVSGEKVLPPQMTGSLFSQIARHALEKGVPVAMEAVRMTPREKQVIDLIAEGLSNKEISSRLHVATHTVKSHVRNIMEKLTLHSRLQIAAYSHRRDEADG